MGRFSTRNYLYAPLCSVCGNTRRVHSQGLDETHFAFQLVLQNLHLLMVLLLQLLQHHLSLQAHAEWLNLL